MIIVKVVVYIPKKYVNVYKMRKIVDTKVYA